MILCPHCADYIVCTVEGRCKKVRDAVATALAKDKIAAMRARDSDGTAIAAANGDLPVPQDCQARAEGIA